MGRQAGDQAVVLAVIGTRPEAIKVAPLVRAGAERSSPVRVEVALTGQHGDVVGDALAAFGLTPDHGLECPRVDGSLGELLAVMVASVGRLVRTRRPIAVVVQGDTSSALAGALAAFYEGVPVVHLEAGLLTATIEAPFPEEGHRRLIAGLAALHLAPTAAAGRNLLQRGVQPDRVVVTGNTVVDALLHTLGNASEPLRADLDELTAGRRIVVATAHRRESWGEPLAEIGRALVTLAERHPDVHVVLVKHPNPTVGEAMARHVERCDRIVCIDPVHYSQFVKLLARSCLVLTDSGGLQEELPSLGVPTIVLRAETERPEGIIAGTAVLAGTDHDRIVELATTALTAPRSLRPPPNPYGDGAAAGRALAAIAWMLGRGPRPTDFAVAGVGSERIDRRGEDVVVGPPPPPPGLEPQTVALPQRVVLAALDE